MKLRLTLERYLCLLNLNQIESAQLSFQHKFAIVVLASREETERLLENVFACLFFVSDPHFCEECASYHQRQDSQVQATQAGLMPMHPAHAQIQ